MPMGQVARRVLGLLRLPSRPCRNRRRRRTRWPRRPGRRNSCRCCRASHRSRTARRDGNWPRRRIARPARRTAHRAESLMSTSTMFSVALSRVPMMRSSVTTPAISTAGRLMKAAQTRCRAAIGRVHASQAATMSVSACPAQPTATAAAATVYSRHQAPAHDPGEHLAKHRVAVGIGAAGDRDHGRHLGIAERGAGADRAAEQERQDHRRVPPAPRRRRSGCRCRFRRWRRRRWRSDCGQLSVCLSRCVPSRAMLASMRLPAREWRSCVALPCCSIRLEGIRAEWKTFNPPLEGGSKNPKDFSGRGISRTAEISPSPKFARLSPRKLSTLPQGEGWTPSASGYGWYTRYGPACVMRGDTT